MSGSGSRAQGFNQAEILDEVYASVSGAAGLRRHLLPEGMFVFLPIGVQRLPLVCFAPAFDADSLFGVLADKSLGSLDEDVATIGGAARPCQTSRRWFGPRPSG